MDTMGDGGRQRLVWTGKRNFHTCIECHQKTKIIHQKTNKCPKCHEGRKQIEVKANAEGTSEPDTSPQFDW